MREISGTAFFYPILNRYSRWLNTVPFKNWLEFEIDYIQQYCSEIIKNLIWFDILENFKFLFQLIFVIIEAIGVFYKKRHLQFTSYIAQEFFRKWRLLQFFLI